jgi:DNA-binding transcriptional LysR family regulator
LKTLERLETFLVVAECGSYTEAAKRLYCSQPTISHHIQQLEEQFHADLFHRAGKQVRLTEQGEIVLDYAKRMTGLVREASIKVKQSLSRQERILSVYVSNYISGYYFPGILTHYHRSFPEQLLEIYTYCYDDLRRSLLDGKTNLAFLPIYPEDNQLHTQFDAFTLFEEELALVVPAGHPWTSRKILYMRDLQGETILLPQSRYMCQYIEDQLRRHGVTVRFLQMSNFGMIKESVKAGLGIAFLPGEVIKAEMDRGELAPVRVSSLAIKRKNGFVIRKQKQLTEEELTFCREVETYFRAQ